MICTFLRSPRLVGALASAMLTVSAAIPTALAHEAPAKAGGGGASMEMHKSMMQGMKEMQSMKPSGNMDQDFAMMMRHHHAKGIEMAQHELKHGKDPKMREMAQKIVDNQKKEIAEFDQWLKSTGHSAAHSDSKR